MEAHGEKCLGALQELMPKIGTRFQDHPLTPNQEPPRSLVFPLGPLRPSKREMHDLFGPLASELKLFV